MTRSRHPSLSLLTACLAAAGIVAACGGSDSPPTTTVSGSVIKGPVNGSAVCAYKAVATGKGEQLKCTTTTATGGYVMDVEYSGDIVVEAVGGTYTDEATNTTKTLSDPMQVVLTSQGGATTGMVTPLTSAAYSVSKGLSGGVTNANYGTAATSVANQFQLSGVNITVTAPAISGATINAYGQILKAVSQFVANGNQLSSVLTFSSIAALQSGFTAAYATANGPSVVFTFSGAAATPVTPTNPAAPTTPATPTTPTTPTTPATPSTPSGESCGITVTGSGTVVTSGFTVPFTLPPTKVCVSGVPANSCSVGNTNLQSLAAGGATPSGNYSMNYQYAYAPGDCTGAIVTVAYKP